MVPNENDEFTVYHERNKTCSFFVVEAGSFTANFVSFVANAERPSDRFDKENKEEMSLLKALKSRCLKLHMTDDDDPGSDDDEVDHSM